MLNLRALALVVGLGVVGCTTAPVLYPAHPLVDQIVKVRAGHEGFLTNRTCSGKDESLGIEKECLGEKITRYPLEAEEFRQTANRLNFLCNIGGKRFKICLDKPGFCRFSSGPKKCSGFLGLFCKEGELLEEYLPVEKYRFLLDAKTKCANKDKYDLWSQ